MASVDDVTKLAALARLSVDTSTLEKFAKEFDAILAYVGQINELSIPAGAGRVLPAVRNVFREDGEPHAPHLYTEKVVAQFPEREGDYLSVKKIISHD